MSLLQSSLIKSEMINDGITPSWEGHKELCWDEISDVEKAARIAKRLLGSPKVATGVHMSVHAKENLWTGDVVVVDVDGGARKWDGVGLPSGIAIGTLTKGNYGWIQAKS